MYCQYGNATDGSIVRTEPKTWENVNTQKEEHYLSWSKCTGSGVRACVPACAHACVRACVSVCVHSMRRSKGYSPVRQTRIIIYCHHTGIVSGTTYSLPQYNREQSTAQGTGCRNKPRKHISDGNMTLVINGIGSNSLQPVHLCVRCYRIIINIASNKSALFQQ